MKLSFLEAFTNEEVPRWIIVDVVFYTAVFDTMKRQSSLSLSVVYILDRM